MIKGSEVIKDWGHVQDDVWKVVLPNTFFGSYNPYQELIRGGWFNSKDREHHTGAVYLNGHWFDEASSLDKIFNSPDANPLWFGQVDHQNTTIFAHFRGVNPNEQTVEINARWAVFYPEKPRCNYITVRGFTMQQAATQWAPPRPTEQVGLIGTHWSKGWIIEDNSISYSRCVGIALGHNGWDNAGPLFTDYAKRGYDFVGWNQDTIGSHVVRNNIISHCEQSGITGSLGAVFSTITGNTIHDIHVRRLFTGWEPAGINSRPDKRVTPYHLAHSTEMAGTSDITGGDNRFYNNIIIGSEEQKSGLSVYNNKELPLQTGGNVYLNGARPYAKEADPLVLAGIDPGLKLVEENGRTFIRFDSFPELDNVRTKFVTTDLLGRARIPDLPFKNPDGSALAVDSDYFGQPRSREQPSPGPFEKPGRGPVSLPVWEPEHESP